MRCRSRILVLLAAAGAVVAWCGAARAAEGPLSQRARTAIATGAEHLLELQENLSAPDATPCEWPYEGVYRVPGKSGREIPIGYRVGGTALCALALIESDPAEGTGRRAAALRRAVAFVLAALEDPRMGPSFTGTYDVRGWGQTYALLLLLRVRSLPAGARGARRPRLDAAIRGLVECLERTEIPGRGGWHYSRPFGARAPCPAASFMTAVVLQSLFAAAAAGEEVERGVIERALARLAEARLANGAVQYGIDRRRRSTSGSGAVEGAIGRTPLVEATLLLAGRGSGARVRRALAAFFEHWEQLEARRKRRGTHAPPFMIAPYYFFFAHLYAAQAIELLPEDERPPLRERLLELLLQVREPDGGWNDRVFARSENVGTAMGVLALMQPALRRPSPWHGVAQGRRFY